MTGCTNTEHVYVRSPIPGNGGDRGFSGEDLRSSRRMIIYDPIHGPLLASYDFRLLTKENDLVVQSFPE
jgi:hypothetical protein